MTAGVNLHRTFYCVAVEYYSFCSVRQHQSTCIFWKHLWTSTTFTPSTETTQDTGIKDAVSADRLLLISLHKSTYMQFKYVLY